MRHWQVGDLVLVQVSKKRRASDEERDRFLQEGQIVLIHRRFAVVQLPRYKEAFWLDDLEPVRLDDEEQEPAGERMVRAWIRV